MHVSRLLAEGRHDDEGHPRRVRPASGPKHVLREPHAPLPGLWSLLPGRLRPKTVRAKIVSLLMVPVISLMTLWAFATVITAQSVSDLARFKEVNATLLAPVSDYVTAVQAERAAAARYLAHPEPARLNALDTRAQSTDAAAGALRRGIDSSSTDTAALSPDLPSRIDRLTAAAGKLPELRQQVTAKQTGWNDAYTGYTDTIDRGLAVDGGLSGISASVVAQGSGREIASQARVVQELSRAREMISREDALVGGSQADGRMPTDRYRSFVGAVQSQQTLFQSAVDDLRTPDEAAYRTVLEGQLYQELRSLEDMIEEAGPGRAAPHASMTTWDHVAGPVLQALHEAQSGASTAAAGKADPLAFDVLGQSGVAVVLGLVGVLLSLLISMQIGRGLVVELVDMRNSALELAGSKLPESLRRLHAGEELDIDAEAPVERRGEDEIGQVGAALNAVHRAAIQAAVERAEVLSGISEVYVKLARRNQVLLHRQLNLLDTMERRIEDPAELEDLFRLDHLTTRMRRHAESLIILSGAAPVRGWRRPVPMLDVVRAAVAEVEDFTRVEVRVPKDVHISGTAVADLTHLLAELVENAVSFSPPHTRVQVRGEGVGTGLALEVEDRGLGMSQQALAQANRKIVDASQVDLLDTDRLGLFVVNRLAHRHGVRVALKPSVYGGVTAVVLVPGNLLEQAEPEDPEHEQGPTTMELPAILDRHGSRRPRPAPAGPLPPQASPPPAAVPGASSGRRPGEGPPFAPDRTWHPAPSDDTSPAPAAPVRVAALRERVDTSRPGASRPDAVPAREGVDPPQPDGVPAPEPVDAPRPGAMPALEPADRWQARPAPALEPAPAQELPAPAPDHASGAPPNPSGGAPPLPQRVRQASLSPQLRDAPAGQPRTIPHIADPVATKRSPERARATMAALRSGWLSGRRADGNTDQHTDQHTDRTTKQNADQNAAGGREGGRPPPPAGDAGHSETPSHGDEA